MSSFRDLRDLINVSRLTYRDSDDENDSITPRNNETIKIINNSLSSSSRTSSSGGVFLNSNEFYDPVSSKDSRNSNSIHQPSISQSMPIERLKKIQQKTNSDDFQLLNSIVHVNNRESLLDRNSKLNVSFSKYTKPLPPLVSKNEPSNSGQEQNNIVSNSLKTRSFIENEEKSKSQPTDVEKVNLSDNDDNNESNLSEIKKLNGNFDDLLTYIDASVVSEWLNRSNRLLKKMFIWHKETSNSPNSTNTLKYESFILFANFWLGFEEEFKFSDKQRRHLIEMEYSIICDEVMQAFQVGIESQKCGMRDVNNLLRAVFKEYPLKLLSFRGTYLLLDFINILSSDRHEDYKNLLSDVKCRTINKQFAQWLLSIRSFALISMCYSIIKFYKKTIESNPKMSVNYSSNKTNLLDELDGRLSSLSLSSDTKYSNMTTRSSTDSSSSTSSFSSSSSIASTKKAKTKSEVKKNQQVFSTIPNEIKYEFYLSAVFKNDLPNVLNYLITTKKCDPFTVDEHGRTLIFLAVMNDKPKILNYLIKRWPSIDINKACDSGNTPLHAAVNKGKLYLVEALLQSLSNEINNNSDKKIFKLDIDKTNEKCMDATPLHLAVWNDFNEIVLVLLQSKANPNLKMNGKTAFDMASENSNEVLIDLLNEYSSLIY